MKRILIAVFVAASALLSGCANFKAIGSFASEGNKVSALVKSDFDLLRENCKEAVKRQDFINQALRSDQGSSKDVCDRFEKGIPALSSVTIELLDEYHEALGKLANGEAWSLRKDLEGVGGALKAVKDRDGALLQGADVDRFTSAAVVIVDALLSVARERAARRLLEPDLPWADVLRPLRTWYGAEGPPNLRNAHSVACQYLKDTWDGLEKRAGVFIQCTVDKRCEPLRGAELAAEAKASSEKFKKCVAPIPGQSSERAKAVVAAIDAWLDANEKLRQEAFKPDPKNLFDALKHLKDQRDVLAKALEGG